MVAMKATITAEEEAAEDSDRSDHDEVQRAIDKLSELQEELEKTFKVNPYFVNAKLIKAIKFSDDGPLMSVGTSILWKLGQGPLGDNNNTKGNKLHLSWESFFNWISDPMVTMNQDMDSEIINEDIWPNPIEHLNNGEDEYDEMHTRTRMGMRMVMGKMMVAERRGQYLDL